MLNRRTLIKTGIAVGAASTLPLYATSAQTPVTEFVSKIGGSRADFDAEYGVGRDQDGWTVYGEDDPATAYYYVLFNDEDIAETIEIDFRHIEGGGTPTEGEVGQSRFIPDDSANVTQSLAGGYRADDPYYSVWQWHSPMLADATGRSGNVIVMDAIHYGGAENGTFIGHTMISMETFEVNEMVPTDEFLGPHSGLAAWEEYAGDSAGMFALTFTDGPVTGEWAATESSVSVIPDEPLTVQDANDLVGSMMPVAEIAYTTYIPPSPLGGEGIRVHGIYRETESAWDTTVAAQWITGGEEAGTVSKILTGNQDVESA